jgi:hypothetical protein
MEVGVHIADVSHYVKPGTLMDQAAFERGIRIPGGQNCSYASGKIIQ